MRKVALVFGIAITLIVITYIAMRTHARGLVAKDIDAIRTLGFPGTRQEFKNLGPKTGGDAGPVYETYVQKMGALTPAQNAAYNHLSDFGLPAGTKKQQEAEVNLVRPLLNPLFVGSKYPRAYFATQVDSDPFAWKAVFLLPHMALIECKAGKTANALEDLRASSHILAQVSQNPDRISELESDDTLNTYREIVGLLRNDPKSLQQIVRDIHSFEPPFNVRWSAMEGFLEDVDMYDNPQVPRRRRDSALSQWISGIYGKSALRNRAVEEISMWRDAFGKLPSDPNNWKGAQSALYGTYKARHPGITGSYKNSTMWACADLMYDYPRDIARRRIVVAAANVFLQKIATGSFPARLPDDSDSIDPFTGKKLIYKLTAHGFTIYSLNQDGVDNGGAGYFGSIKLDIAASY